MIAKKQDNSENVLKRIYEKGFKVLRDPNGIALNVSYTDDGLKWTTDSKGKNLYFTDGNYVEDFKPDLNVIREKSFRTKCEKRWIDKANSMLYEQRPFFKDESIKTKSQNLINGYPNIN